MTAQASAPSVPGLTHSAMIGLLHGAIAVDVDGNDFGAALLARLDRVRHHVDLGVDRIGAPDNDAVGLAPSRADRARASAPVPAA